MDSTTALEKTEEDLQREIDELHRQQRQITKWLRDPRGIRRGGPPVPGPRNFAANGARQKGFVRQAERNDVEDQPPAKRRLLSAVVKYLDENQKLILAILDNQNLGKLVECAQTLSRVRIF